MKSLCEPDADADGEAPPHSSSLCVWSIPVLFVFAPRTPVHLRVIRREVVHLVIPSAAFAHRDLPAAVRFVDGQPCFCIAWDSSTRTPNQAVQQTALSICFHFDSPFSPSLKTAFKKFWMSSYNPISIRPAESRQRVRSREAAWSLTACSISVF